MSNDTCRHILRRVAQRSFDITRPVPEEVVKEIISVCVSSPSARFAQSLDYYYCEDPRLIQVNAAKLMPEVLKLMPAAEERMKTMGVSEVLFYDAALVIFFCAHSPEAIEKNPMINTDVGIAAENAIIAAESHGLSTIHIGFVALLGTTVNEAFGIPADKRVMHAVAIGYNKSPRPEPKPRRPDCVYKLE